MRADVIVNFVGASVAAQAEQVGARRGGRRHPLGLRTGDASSLQAQACNVRSCKGATRAAHLLPLQLGEQGLLQPASAQHRPVGAPPAALRAHPSFRTPEQSYSQLISA